MDSSLSESEKTKKIIPVVPVEVESFENQEIYVLQVPENKNSSINNKNIRNSAQTDLRQEILKQESQNSSSSDISSGQGKIKSIFDLLKSKKN